MESRLGSFNVSLPSAALKLYNDSYYQDNFSKFTAMVSDIRTVCPLQKMANLASNNFVAKVYSYVSKGKRTSDLGHLADRTSDVAAIFGKIDGMKDFVDNMQNMFYQFVNLGTLPQDKDLTLGMYVVDDEIVTQRNYHSCDFWENANEIVPKFAYRH